MAMPPPYIPGTILVVSTLVTGVIAFINPDDAKDWTANTIIYAYAATATICIAMMAKWIANKFLASQDESTKAMNRIADAMNKVDDVLTTQVEFFHNLGTSAIEERLNLRQQRFKKHE